MSCYGWAVWAPYRKEWDARAVLPVNRPVPGRRTARASGNGGSDLRVSRLQKFDRGLEGFSGFVDSLGVPLADIVGPAVALLELVGGIMLVAGLLTRVVSLLFALEMIRTTWLVKLDVGLIAPMGGGAGAEIDVALWGAVVALLFLGPGVLAIDRIVGIERRSL